MRGPVDAPKYKDFILPLMFLKRVSHVFEYEVERLSTELAVPHATALEVAESDHSLVRFFIPKDARWQELIKVRAGLGQRLTTAFRDLERQNPMLAGTFGNTDWNATHAGERIVTDDHPAEVMQVLNKHRLGLRDVQPDLIGDAYEYLLAKFAEGSGQSPGEFYTPRQVARLMARLLEPQPGMEIYDPCCGWFSLLIKCAMRLLETRGVERNGRLELPSSVPPVRLYGQEVLPSTYSMAKMNAFIHQVEARIEVGDTMNRPRFLQGDGSMKRFDRVTANRMWNQDIFRQSTYENDTYGRFPYGFPPNSTADWGRIQHMLASLKPNGKAVVILDTGAVSPGSGSPGSDRERDSRQKVVEADLVETVILRPANIFTNMNGPSEILVLNKAKPRRGETLIINASGEFGKGRPKNELTDANLDRITAAGLTSNDQEGFSTHVTTAEIAKNDYNLSPSRYVSDGASEDVLPLEEAVVLLRAAEEEAKIADSKLNEILATLGLV